MKKKLYLLTIAAVFTTVKAQNNSSLLYNNLPFSMPQVTAAVFPSNSVNIEKYGAKGDGKTDNTKAITKAIDELSAQGGGTLEIPAGTWVTGPIVLKSNINIHTVSGTNVLFSTNRDSYNSISKDSNGKTVRKNLPCISAENAENIALTGDGSFDGSGQVWRPVKKGKLTPAMWDELVASGGVLTENKKMWYPSESAYRGSFIKESGKGIKTDEEWMSVKDFYRPNMIFFSNCKNVLLTGVTIKNSPSWTIHPMLCQNVIISNISVINPEYGQNTDAMDIESCKNVLITNSTLDVGDDALCIKSGKNEAGRERGVPSENILIDKCTVFHAHGGFVIGSEMSGGVRNIKVTNCRFVGTATGLRFKSTRGRGGVVENIYIENLVMKDIKEEAVLFDLFYGNKGESETTKNADDTTPSFKDIYMKNINSSGSKTALYFNGLPEMHLRNIALKDAAFSAESGGLIAQADNISLENVKITAPSTPIIKLDDVSAVSISNLSFPEIKNPKIEISGKSSSIIIKKSPAISFKNINAQQDVKQAITIQ